MVWLYVKIRLSGRPFSSQNKMTKKAPAQQPEITDILGSLGRCAAAAAPATFFSAAVAALYSESQANH